MLLLVCYSAAAAIQYCHYYCYRRWMMPAKAAVASVMVELRLTGHSYVSVVTSRKRNRYRDAGTSRTLACAGCTVLSTRCRRCKMPAGGLSFRPLSSSFARYRSRAMQSYVSYESRLKSLLEFCAMLHINFIAIHLPHISWRRTALAAYPWPYAAHGLTVR